MGAAIGRSAGGAGTSGGHGQQAQLAYQDRIRAYHQTLRQFYYRYLFTDTPFGKEDFARTPRFPSS